MKLIIVNTMKINNIYIKNKIIIWGVDDYNVMGLLRQLGKYDFDIIFMVYQGLRGCATSSKYCKRYVLIPTLDDGLTYLLSNFNNEPYKPIILNSNDLVAEFLDEKRELLSKYFVVPGTKIPGSLRKFDSKSVMTQVAEEIGFSVPKSKEVKWNSDITDVEFPCLLKPTQQTEGKYNEFKFKICNTRRILENTLRFVRKESTFILQQYIPKESVALVYGCRTLDGKVHLAGVLEKDRFCDNGDGSHGVLKAEFPDYIKADLIEKFMERVDFYGLFSVEYLVYNKTAYFIEINWRNDGTSHLFYQAGANIPLLWVRSSLGDDVNDVPVRVTTQSFFIDEIFDEDNIKKKVLSRDQWIAERERATVFKYYDIEDMAPYEVVKKGKRKKLLLDSMVAKNRLYIVYIMDKLGIRRK